ncbi:hypothetical protein RMR16_008650 [Agrobacterium sp. rho-13.3]|uniref:hypothetical protein n=1 Tax=Agrobacterium sp. rho-13.3 TaxID=3072980 RepID=UPI002A0DF275|nr:hypothetical protein [Agrobacterium sp. rho-13.3]MDX8310019.1 hypothetical protein [Agrobacterium sp. rho-13.3]
MTHPVWPVELPKPERGTWQSTPQDARLKRRSDAGPTSYRRRFSSASRTVSLSIVVNRNGKERFDRFFQRDTKGGSLLFWMPDPTTQGWALGTSDGAALLTGDGARILMARRWLVTFGGNLPVETVQGVEFRFSFSVEVMP